MKLFAPFLVALQFLTRVPVPLSGVASRETIGRSLLYYPLVGLVLGIVLTLLNDWLAGAPSLLRAVIVLTAWIALTGALHLDGLADSADAWVGGIGDRRRTLAIMKDPYCGPAAVVTLIAVLLLKAAALDAIRIDEWLALAAVPMLARASIPLLFLTTPYVRQGGIGTALSTQLRRVPTITVLVGTAAVTVYALEATGVWMLAICAATLIGLRAMMRHRIGGITGDTAGASIEIGETALLVFLALRQG